MPYPAPKKEKMMMMKTMKKMKPMDFTPMEPLKKMKDYEDDFDRELMKVEKKGRKSARGTRSAPSNQIPDYLTVPPNQMPSKKKANAMNKRQEKADRAVLTKGMKK